MKKLLFLVPFFQSVVAFDLGIATRNLHIAAASYCDIEQLTNWNCKHCLPKIQVQAIIPDPAP